MSPQLRQDVTRPEPESPQPRFGLVHFWAGVVTSHPVVGSWSLHDRTSSPAARSASGWVAYVRHDADTSTHPCLRATSRAPCCDGRRSRSPEPAMPCSRASNSRKPDLVVSLDYPLLSDDCFRLRFQPIDATHWPKRSAGVSKASVSRGRSFNRRAMALSLL